MTAAEIDLVAEASRARAAVVSALLAAVAAMRPDPADGSRPFRRLAERRLVAFRQDGKPSDAAAAFGYAAVAAEGLSLSRGNDAGWDRLREVVAATCPEVAALFGVAP